MKTISSFALTCVVFLYLAVNVTNAKTSSLSANPESASIATTTTPDCDCNGNILTNGSFESGTNGTTGWTTTGSWSKNTTYDVCGTYATVLEGAGTLYQDENIIAGTTVNFSIYGGYHVKKNQKFFLIFYSAANVALLTKEVAVDRDVDKAQSGPILTQYSLTGVAPAGTKYVRAMASGEGDFFKIDGACMTIILPVADCGCDDNVLKNPSFESGTTDWTAKGTWTKNTQYDVCGTYAAVLEGAGSLTQKVLVTPQTVVDFSAFGGYHEFKNQKFRLTFYNAAGVSLSSTEVAVDWDVDNYQSGSILKKYSLNATAPANTNYVIAEASSDKDDWFKVDGACLRVTPPAPDCNCDGNTLLNPSFETFDATTKLPTSWKSSNDAGKIFTDDSAYPVCGSKNGLLGTAGGSFWQDVNIIAGSVATLNIWGGYHVNQGHKFKLVFYGSTNNILDTKEVALTKAVEDLPKTGPNGMTQYTLTGTAPAGTSFVRVLGTATGNYFKVDNACLKIVAPVCETCTGNKLDNPSFEDGVTGWTTVSGTPATSTNNVVCGAKSGYMSGKGTLTQTKTIAPGNTVTWTMYGGYGGTASVQTFKIKFYNGNTELTGSTLTQVIDKNVATAPLGMKKYTMTKQAPATTTKVVIEIASSAGELYYDLGCMTVKTDTPLPVTLTDFSIKKEGTSAALTWRTTAETNSKSFEVQHSQNGKEWAILGSVDAQGESTVTKSYSYTHTNPANGNNLYRLRMIDIDETFAYSRIVSESFVTEASALLYPNPSSNFMKLRNGKETIASIQIYDIRGVKVKDFIPKDGVDVDISSLTVGTYIVTFKQSNGLVTKQKIEVIR